MDEDCNGEEDRESPCCAKGWLIEVVDCSSNGTICARLKDGIHWALREVGAIRESIASDIERIAGEDKEM